MDIRMAAAAATTTVVVGAVHDVEAGAVQVPRVPRGVPEGEAVAGIGITFDNSNPYTITGGAADIITLDGGTSPAGIDVLNGTHTLAAFHF